MNLRAALLLVVGGFVVLLIAMGFGNFFRWLKQSYPRSFPWILGTLILALGGAGMWITKDMLEQPAFRPHDLITVHEPVVAQSIGSGRESRILPCIIDSAEHLAVVDTAGASLIARVESNNTSAPVYCAVGADVRIESAGLHRFTVTHRQPF